MKKRMNRVSLVLTVIFILFAVSACGNKPFAETLSNETEIEESTIETVEGEEETAESESSESEETEPIQSATGHQHNIDIEEKMNETDVEEEVQEEERKEEVQSQTAVAEKKETEVQTSTAETTTAPTSESLPTPTVAPDTIPESITMDPNFEKCSMYVLYDTQVKDAPYSASGNQGLITRGSNIGVMERCIETGYYRVNYGAKAGYLPGDALSTQDPFAN